MYIVRRRQRRTTAAAAAAQSPYIVCVLLLLSSSSSAPMIHCRQDGWPKRGEQQTERWRGGPPSPRCVYAPDMTASSSHGAAPREKTGEKKQFFFFRGLRDFSSFRVVRVRAHYIILSYYYWWSQYSYLQLSRKCEKNVTFVPYC